MPSKPTKSILKHPKTASGARPGPSKSAARGSGEAGPSTLNANTKINSASKFSKKLNVERKSVHSQRPSKKVRRQSRPVKDEESEDDSEDGGDVDEDADVDVDMEGEDSGLDTDEEIARGLSKDGSSSKKATKRKRPATTAETFGSTLTSLLSESTTKPSKKSTNTTTATTTTTTTDEPESKKAKTKSNTNTNIKTPTPAANKTILSLSQAKPPPSRSTENLERKAKRHIQALKEEKEDKARIRDVVEGWAARNVSTENGEVVIGGQEFEKSLMKTAQRGVIKLFNAILVAAKNAEEATTSLSAKAGVKDEGSKGKKEKDNIMGRGGKEGVLTQESFLDMVRKG